METDSLFLTFAVSDLSAFIFLYLKLYSSSTIINIIICKLH